MGRQITYFHRNFTIKKETKKVVKKSKISDFICRQYNNSCKLGANSYAQNFKNHQNSSPKKI
jgi:hypothetical protein